MKIMRMFILCFICLLLSFASVMAQDTLNVKLQGRWAYGPSYAVKIASVGGSDYAFIGNGGYLQVIDLGAGPPPDEEGKIVLPEPLKAVDVAIISGTDYAFVADGAHGLRIIDVSTPATPVEVGSYDTPGSAMDVVVDPTLELAFIADGLEGLIVIDVSTPASPNEHTLHHYKQWRHRCQIRQPSSPCAVYQYGDTASVTRRFATRPKTSGAVCRSGKCAHKPIFVLDG